MANYLTLFGYPLYLRSFLQHLPRFSQQNICTMSARSVAPLTVNGALDDDGGCCCCCCCCWVGDCRRPSGTHGHHPETITPIGPVAGPISPTQSFEFSSLLRFFEDHFVLLKTSLFIVSLFTSSRSKLLCTFNLTRSLRKSRQKSDNFNDEVALWLCQRILKLF